MRAPFAYVPRPGVLQEAHPAAAIAFLASIVFVAFLFESPIVVAAAGAGAALAGFLAGARRAVAAALRLGLALLLLITVVNAIVTDRGSTVLARLGDFPVLGRVDITAEAIAAGAIIGLRAVAAMVAAAVYSACVDPDRVLRLLRPVAGRSALTATLISRLVPLAAADHVRLREAAALRGPAAAPAGRGPLARRLLAGSLDRAVDVAATLELRGYGSPTRVAGSGETRGRSDTRLWIAAGLLVALGLAVKISGADSFEAYPTLEVGFSAELLVLAGALVAAGFVPLRRRRRRRG
jgi:energy-coupling factor transport system permease protein